MSRNTWVLREDRLPAYKQNVGDILFTTGNGILGVAGVPALAPLGAQGMFAGGLYADGSADLFWVPEPGHAARNNERFPTDEDIYHRKIKALIACPRVFAVSLKWNGAEIECPAGFTRTLDMETGLLGCAYAIDVPGGKLNVRETRFVSMDDLHLLAQRLEVTSSIPGSLEVALVIDGTAGNMGRHHLWQSRTATPEGDALLWHGVAEGTGSELAVCQKSRADTSPVFDTASTLACATVHAFELRAETPVVIDRLVGTGFTTYDNNPQSAARDAAEAALRGGFDACASRHTRHWEGFWRDNDIKIDGPEQDQLAVRYSLFQLHSATPPPDGIISIGAKFLSGEWYRACVFWDDDVFIAPYFAKVQPDAARGHLRYRYRTLEAAKEEASERGYRGAFYPLESMPPTGEHACAPWIIFGEKEIHTSCDIAWAILDYFRWTGDTEFMEQEGAEILTETARFWMSRLTETERGLELLGVCGPDEYHPVVDNNVYTNVLVRENLKLAAKHSEASDEEKQAWLAAAERIVCAEPGPDGLIEQSEGFFSLPDWRRGQYVEKAVEFQLLKQADLVMLPVMLPELYSKEIVQANYDYYEPHTVHESSLSAGVHAIVAAQLGMLEEAYDKFCFTAFMQLEDRLENTHMGLHAACTGMVPRIVIEGFAGLCIEDGKPAVSPRLPDAWSGIDFQFSFQGRRFRCHIGCEGQKQTASITAQ